MRFSGSLPAGEVAPGFLRSLFQATIQETHAAFQNFTSSLREACIWGTSMSPCVLGMKLLQQGCENSCSPAVAGRDAEVQDGQTREQLLSKGPQRNEETHQALWFAPATLATWEAEIEMVEV
jgi:hypothetical protein